MRLTIRYTSHVPCEIDAYGDLIYTKFQIRNVMKPDDTDIPKKK